MFVKVYRYHIQPHKTEKFLDIQERAGKIYRKHISYRVVYLESTDHPGQWVEIQWCSDENAYRRAMDSINAEPGIKELWQEFQTVLDPEKPGIQEECFEQIHSVGDLPVR